jgi:hypothetical protein
MAAHAVGDGENPEFFGDKNGILIVGAPLPDVAFATKFQIDSHSYPLP